VTSTARDRTGAGYWGAALAGLAWICLSPWPLTAAAADVDRRGLIWALGAAALLLPLLSWSGLRRAGSGLALACGIWLALDGLSATLALHPWMAWLGGPERGIGMLDQIAWLLCLLALFGGLLGTTPETGVARSRRILGGLIAIGAAMALLLLGELVLVDGRIGRAAGMQGNAVYSASVLAPLLVLALGQLRSARGIWPLIVVVLLAGGLLSTGGRAGVLAALVGVGLLWLGRLGAARRQGTWTMDRRWLWPVGGLLLIGLAGLWQLRPASVEIRAHLYQAALAAPLQENALQRWDGAVDPLAEQRFWIGFGRDNIEPPLTRLRPEALNALEDRGFDRLADRSHSMLLDRWVEGGALALSSGALLLGLLIWRTRHTGYRSFGTVEAALLTALLDRTFGVPSAGADLLLAMLLALSLARWLAPSMVVHAAPGAASPARPAEFSFAIMLLPALLLVGAGMAGGHSWLWRDGSSPALSLDAVPIGCQASKLGDPARLIAIARQPYSIRPWLASDDAEVVTCPGPDHAGFFVRAAPSMPRAWLLSSAIALDAGDTRTAHLDLQRALQLLGASAPSDQATRQQAYLWARLASASAAALQQDAASRAIAALQAVGPDSHDAAWWRTIAYMHALLGEHEQAVSAYRMAIEIDFTDRPSQRNLERLQELAADPSPPAGD
jgi:hypothetical protein